MKAILTVIGKDKVFRIKRQATWSGCENTKGRNI